MVQSTKTFLGPSNIVKTPYNLNNLIQRNGVVLELVLVSVLV